MAFCDGNECVVKELSMESCMVPLRVDGSDSDDGGNWE